MTLSALKRFLDRSAEPDPKDVPERCEMCAVAIPEEHSHVVNIETRRLICTCRPCYLLFGYEGAARGKMRAVPDRYRRDPDFRIDDQLWSRLEIPVRTAFFFKNSELAKFVAFYPSPAGATESTLSLEAWAEVASANPVLSELMPDVEALLVHAPRGEGFDCYLVPINACYELVGKVRQHWKGFEGGPAAWAEIDGFFGSLRARSEAS